MPPDQLAKLKRVRDAGLGSIGLAGSAGVRRSTEPTYSAHHDAQLTELELRAQAQPAAEVLRAATVDAAALLDPADLEGSPGARADLLPSRRPVRDLALTDLAGSGTFRRPSRAAGRWSGPGPAPPIGQLRTAPEELTVPKYVYDFTEGNKDLKDLLGGKGANLAEMTNLGLPVPPGFTITTEACRAYLQRAASRPSWPTRSTSHLAAMEKAIGRRSATRTTRCWSPSAPGPSSRCPG